MTDRRRVKKIIKIWAVLGVILVIGGYGAFRAKNLAEGPEINVVSPADGLTVTDPFIEIKGNSKNISRLFLNDNKIFTDESGEFDEKILLATGYNIITLRAEDRFGRTVSKTLQLIYK